MSSKAQVYVAAQSQATGLDYLVLCQIADNAGDDGELPLFVYIDTARLAKKCRLSEEDLEETLTHLVSMRELIPARSPYDGNDPEIWYILGCSFNPMYGEKTRWGV